MHLSNNYFYKPTAFSGLHVGQDWLAVIASIARASFRASLSPLRSSTSLRLNFAIGHVPSQGLTSASLALTIRSVTKPVFTFSGTSLSTAVPFRSLVVMGHPSLHLIFTLGSVFLLMSITSSVRVGPCVNIIPPL